MIIVDCNSLCYKAFFSYGALTTADEKTGIVYGFFRDIYNLKKKYNNLSPFLFTWDSKESKRREIYPLYKANRTKTKSMLSEEDFAQFDLLRTQVLQELGFTNIYYRNGYEADDLIALICHKFKNSRKVIVSSDQDLYQLLSSTTMMYKPKKDQEYTLKDFKRQYKITPVQWAEVKAIAGCSTDNVKGIRGVGEATAIKIIKGTHSQKGMVKIKQQQSIIDRNRELVKLPFEDFPIRIPIEDSFNWKAFKIYCYRFGFNSIITELPKWKQLFLDGTVEYF